MRKGRRRKHRKRSRGSSSIGSSVQPAAYGRTIELGRTSRGRDFIDEVHMQYLWMDL